VLGLFGRYGLAFAAHEATSSAFTEAAFAAYRNFDGNGSRFGDTALSAATSDVERITVYASLDWAEQSRVVMLLINKSAKPVMAGPRLAHPNAYSGARTWVLTQQVPTLVTGKDVQSAALNAFRWPLPARSLTVFLPTLDAP
jgi:hypothetical protein